MDGKKFREFGVGFSLFGFNKDFKTNRRSSDFLTLFVLQRNRDYVQFFPNIEQRSIFFLFLTSLGIPGSIFNGVCDWVYEEEVISDTRALWFSPDSNYITWIEFNDTAVETMPLQVYGPPGRLDFQYPIPTPLR